MGPWWFAQFDPVSEVSQAAKRSFQVCSLVITNYSCVLNYFFHDDGTSYLKV